MLSFRVCRGHINCMHMTSRKTVRSEKLIIIGCRNKLNDCKVTKKEFDINISNCFKCKELFSAILF